MDAATTEEMLRELSTKAVVEIEETDEGIVFTMADGSTFVIPYAGSR